MGLKSTVVLWTGRKTVKYGKGKPMPAKNRTPRFRTGSDLLPYGITRRG